MILFIRKPPRLRLTLSSALTIVLVAFILWKFIGHNELEKKARGVDVSTFNFTTLDGAPQSLASQPGRKVVLLWATWCGPCQAELAAMQKAVTNEMLPTDRFYAVSVGEEAEVVATAAKERGYTFPVYLTSTEEAGAKVPFEVFPTTVFLDENNRVTDMDSGLNFFLPWKAWYYLRKNPS